MDVVLWVIRALLALAFAGAGIPKLVRHREELVRSRRFVEDFSDRSVKLIGAAEVLGAVGLVLPSVIGVATWLAPVAAGCLAALMVGAVATHLRREEPRKVIPNVALLALAALVAATQVW